MEVSLFDKAIDLSMIYDFKDELSIFIANNKSNNLPYHNMNHCFYVMNSCYEIVNSCSLYNKINHEDMRNLMIASLYHDYMYINNPSLPDHIKVENTISKFPNGTSFNKVVIELVRYTAYPYREGIDHKPGIGKIEEMGLILRESDISQYFTKSFIQTILYNLRKEMDPENRISITEFASGCVEFLKSINLQLIDNSIKDHYIFLLEKFIDLYEYGKKIKL